jgi:TP901 family phage tail tape measure protein
LGRERTIKVTLQGDASSVRAAMGQTGSVASTLGGSLRRLAGIAGFAGLAVSIKRAATASIKMSLDFEKSMAKIVGLVGVSSDQVAAWSKDLLELSPKVAKSPQELADALFFITSAGIKGSKAIDVLTSSARAATAGLGETKTVADTVTSAINAYGQANLSAEEATNVLIATVREGKLEPEELAGSLGKVLPIAAELGVTFDQVGASVAAMSRLGLDAATSTTALRGIMAGLLKPTAQAEAELTKYGLSSAELRRQIREEGLLSVLMMLRDSFGANEESLSKVFGNVRALTGVLNLVGANAEKTSEIFAAMSDNTGDLDDAFAAVAETSGFKLEQGLAKLQVIGTEIGDELVPVLAQAMEDLGPLIEDVGRAFVGFATDISFAAGTITRAEKTVRDFESAFGGPIESAEDLGVALGDLHYAGTVMGQMLDSVHLGFMAAKTTAEEFDTAVKELFSSTELSEGELRELKKTLPELGEELDLSDKKIASVAAVIDEKLARNAEAARLRGMEPLAASMSQVAREAGETGEAAIDLGDLLGEAEEAAYSAEEATGTLAERLLQARPPTRSSRPSTPSAA